MKNIIMNSKITYMIASILVVIIYSCQPDDENLQEATFPDIAEVFIDTFSPGLQYAAFGTSKVTAFDVDTDITFQGNASMRFDIPNTSDPEGGFAGGVFTTGVGRNLTNYNVLTFYARGSRGETINQIGYGLTFEGEVYRTQISNVQIGTDWQKYYIPIPDAAKLTEERGMLWIAEAADDGESYQLWIDEVKFENIDTIIQESASILNGVDQVTAASAGTTITIDGTSASYNLPSGIVQNLTMTAAYFDYTSSNESVATVDEFGIVSVTSDEGSAIISATLNGLEANGSITFMDVDSSGNVDDSDATEITLPLGFESTTLNYNPIGFEGAVPSIAANPVVGGLNNSSNVLRSLKSDGSIFFAGQFIDLDVPVDFATNQIVSALVLSPTAGTPVRVAFENSQDSNTQIRVDVTTTVSNQWQELVFDFTPLINSSTIYDRMVIIFDIDEANPTSGDGSVYYIDDIQLVGDADDDGGSPDNLLSNGDFEEGMTVWEGNGFNVQTDGGNSFNFVDVMTAGNPFDVNLSQRGLNITEGQTYTLKFDASTDAATGSRTMIAGIGLFVDPFTNQSMEVTVTETAQTFTLELDANFSSTDGRVLFDMGADTGIIVIDNVSLVVSDDGGSSGSNVLDNGDFEEGMTVWEGNGFNVQTDGGNSFNFVDVMTAGNPFDVNLSQRGIDITEGQTFTLTFDASTDAATGSRTMLAGIGLFVAPFTNQSMEVTITETTQTYTLELDANFSSADGRVLFDMGADTGVIVIDNVSLTLN